MESLHPLVGAIVNGLLNSPLQALGREALDRIALVSSWGPDDDALEDTDADMAPKRERERSVPDPRDAALGLWQLAAVEQVVQGRLKREIEIAARLPALAEQLKLKAVLVEGVEARLTRAGDGGLLAPDRRAALKTFTEAFNDAIQRARQALEEDLQAGT